MRMKKVNKKALIDATIEIVIALMIVVSIIIWVGFCIFLGDIE